MLTDEQRKQLTKEGVGQLIRDTERTGGEVGLVALRLAEALNNPPSDDPTSDKADGPASELADRISDLLDGETRIVKLFALYLSVRWAEGVDEDDEVPFTTAAAGN
jgi:hypothetical protein